jgi:hypothetical protein
MPKTSSTVFEIVNGGFVYRGWDVRADFIHTVETPQCIRFGRDMTLRLVDGEPKLNVPKYLVAELRQSNYAFKDGQGIDGKFVEVVIYH